MTHIDKAKQAAERTDTMSPAFGNYMLQGILHALLAIHDQNTGATPAKRTTTKKADQ